MYLQVCLANGLDFFEESLQFRKRVMSAQEKTVINPVCGQTEDLSSACQRVIYDKFVHGAKYGIFKFRDFFCFIKLQKDSAVAAS